MNAMTEVTGMSDRYFEAVQEQWSYIRALYLTYKSKKPIVLYDIDEKKIYAYPYKDFESDLNETSQTLLQGDYTFASTHESMVVFVRDNTERKLVSYVVSIENAKVATPLNADTVH
jgi:hypothetical protein